MREKTMSRSKVRQHRERRDEQTRDNLPRTEEKRQIISGSKAASMTKVCTAEHKTNITFWLSSTQLSSASSCYQLVTSTPHHTWWRGLRPLLSAQLIPH